MRALGAARVFSGEWCVYVDRPPSGYHHKMTAMRWTTQDRSGTASEKHPPSHPGEIHDAEEHAAAAEGQYRYPTCDAQEHAEGQRREHTCGVQKYCQEEHTLADHHDGIACHCRWPYWATVADRWWLGSKRKTSKGTIPENFEWVHSWLIFDCLKSTNQRLVLVQSRSWSAVKQRWRSYVKEKADNIHYLTPGLALRPSGQVDTTYAHEVSRTLWARIPAGVYLSSDSRA